MPYEFDPEALTEAEADIRSRLADQEVDLTVNNTVSNLYRASTVLSRTAEREVLSRFSLSWSAFGVLWVLWVWGEMDGSRLAGELGLTLGTVTGVRTRLEAQDLVESYRPDNDNRRRLARLTESGSATIEEVFPIFNRWCVEFLGDLTPDGVTDLSRLLEAIILRPTTRDEPFDPTA